MLQFAFYRSIVLLSETPGEEIWDLLRLNVIPQHLNASSPDYRFSKAKSQAIRTLLDQSYEFFQASLSASLLTSPLLDFYSYVTGNSTAPYADTTRLP